MPDPEVNEEIVAAHGLTRDEYAKILEILGRKPNLLELGIFSVMWSEHCSYKSSKVHLRRLPTQGPCVVQGPGENAGVVDFGDDDLLIFKVESHNHPSYVEPFQGAATGVGGIMRDIFTMGARPIASLDSLRFGDPQKEERPGKTRFYLKRVVDGVGSYGNCMGVATVGGEIYFDPSYEFNVLVNAFNLGVAKKGKLFLGHASGVGNPVIYLGSRTGRDGIHGASLLASSEFDEASGQKRPRVQVGDPFTEKKVCEAVLEIMAKENGWLVGIQDMGAAGLTCSSFEMASRAEAGMILDLDRVPAREAGMTPYEYMLSESQERMLLVVKKGHERDVEEVCRKWDLECAVVGEVTSTGVMKILHQGACVGEIPVAPISSEAPEYRRPWREPARFKENQRLSLDDVPMPSDLNEVAKKMLASPNLVSRLPVYEQYDYQVGNDTVFKPGAECALLRVKGQKKAIALSINGNGRYCYLNPKRGAMIAVAEGVRSLACSGARTLAFSDCLNFGNPEKEDIMWEFSEAIDGLREACLFFSTPIVSGNVSFYNETNGKAIIPTPVLAAVGRLDDHDRRVGAFFINPGDLVFLLGETREELGGSEYLYSIHGLVRGAPPELDLEREKALHGFLIELAKTGMGMSARDCSEGGLLQTLVECCLASPLETLGFQGSASELPKVRGDALLFSESQSRAVVSVRPADGERLREMAGRMGVPCALIGEVLNSERLTIAGMCDLNLREIAERWWRGLERI